MSEIIRFQDQKDMADAIAQSGLFGMKSPVQVLALMAVAQAEGRHPASVARDYHIISGKPSLKADAMLSRFQEKGGKVEWKTYTDTEVTGVFSHPSGGSVAITWNLAMAKHAGVGSSGTLSKFPRAMLRARCISEGVRTVFPAVLCGFYTPEEVEGFTQAPVEVSRPIPEGIAEIAKQLDAAADNGLQAYREAWLALTPEQRTFIGPEVHAGFKARAEKICARTDLQEIPVESEVVS